MRNFKPRSLVGGVLVLAGLLGWSTGVSAITIHEEAELAKEFLKAVDGYYKKIEDPVIVDYVDRVGRRVLRAIGPQPFAYRFYVVHDHTLNAFAGPGGNVFVTTGMLSVMTEESDLAGLMAHEIAHGVCRHISEGMARSQRLSMMTLAGLAASVLVGSQVSGEAAQALAATSMAAGQSLSLAYSRENETQADQLGLSYLSKAGYTYAGLERVLRKILDQRWYSPEQVPTYLSTHPGLEDRLASLATLRHAYPEPKGSAEMTPVGNFDRVHARVVIEYGDTTTNLNTFSKMLAERPEDPEINYYYGLLQAKQGHWKEAIDRLRKALEKKPFDTGLLTDLGRVYFLDGDYKRAKPLLQSAVELDTDNIEGRYFLGRILLDEGQAEASVRLFAPLVDRRITFDRMSFFMGQAYGALQETGKSHYYLGYYQKRQHNLRAAKFHFQKALQSLGDSTYKHRAQKELDAINEIEKKDRKDTPPRRRG